MKDLRSGARESIANSKSFRRSK